MRIVLALPLLLLPLAGCQSTLSGLTPAQQAALACLGATAGAALATDLAPNKAAVVSSTGQVLCTTATGAATIVTK
jgi:hypothetical protein